MNRLRNVLCVILSLVLLGIYYRFPIGHLSSEQSVWLVFKIMVMVFAAAFGFEWLAETASRPLRRRLASPKSRYADTAPSA